MSPLRIFRLFLCIGIRILVKIILYLLESIVHAFFYYSKPFKKLILIFAVFFKFFKIMSSKSEIRAVVLYCLKRGLGTTQAKKENAALKDTSWASFATIQR